MTLKGITAVGATLVVALLIWRWNGRELEPPRGTLAARPEPVELARTTAPAEEDTELARAPVPVEAQGSAPPEPAILPAMTVLRGLLVDVRGNPLPGRTITWRPRAPSRLEGNWLVEELPATRASESSWHMIELTDEVRRRIREEPTFLEALLRGFRDPAAARKLILDGPPPQAEATTDASGRFVLRVEEGDGELSLVDDRLLLLASGVVRSDGGEGERILVGTHPVDVAGVVVDANGNPVACAFVSSSAGLEGLPGFPFVVEDEDLSSVSTGSADDGRFEFHGIPWAPARRVVATKRGHRSASEPLPEHGASGLTLVLQEEENRRFVTGRVLHADGRPAPGAYVVLGQDSDQTDENGAFEIEISSLWERAPLVAHLRGFQIARRDGFADELRATQGSRDGLELVLGGETKTIRGRVLDAGGEPAPGLQIELVEPTYYGPNTGEPIERTGVITDAGGSFLLEELQDRAYRVRVLDPSTFLTVDSEPVPAGTDDLVVRLPADATHAEVRGRVVTYDGEALPGVEVAYGLTTRRTEGMSISRNAAGVRTDASGRFVLRDVPQECGFLQVGGPLVDSQKFDIEGLDLSRPVELHAHRLLRFSVVLGADETADELGFLDGNGEPLKGMALRPDSTLAFRRLVATAGETSPTIEITDEVAYLALYRQDEELRRIPVQGALGEIVTLRP